MNTNYLSEELLLQYLRGKLTPEEQLRVKHWIHASAENLQQFTELEEIWMVTSFSHLKQHADIEKEWLRFANAIDKSRQGTRPSQIDVELPNFGTAKVIGITRFNNYLKKLAVAASIVAVIATIWVFSTGKTNDSVGPPQNGGKQKSFSAQLRHEVNSGTQVKKLVLKDSTTVFLGAGSEIIFADPFPNNARNITLLGKANFRVAKDKARPFTVSCGDIAVTAVGTIFDVITEKRSGTIAVRLYEGKVLVGSVKRPGAEKKRELKNDYLLTPGYELVYNEVKVEAIMRAFSAAGPAEEAAVKDSQVPMPDDPNIPAHRNKRSWYMFNNQPLSQVLDQLKEMYKTEIVYDKKEISGIYFIGEFSKEDSLEMVLEQIAASNRLRLIKQHDQFIISK